MRRLITVLAFALSLAAALPVLGQEAGLGRTLDSLLTYARQNNPEYAAVQWEAEAARERIYPAGALADPILRAELQNLTNFGSDASPNLLPGRVGGTKYTLIQPLPFWGKRELKRQAAAAEVEVATGKSRTTWAEQAARIKTAYAQSFAVAQLIRLNNEVTDLIDRIQGITQARYAGGLVPQQDVIRVQVERTAMRSELIQLENEQHHARARLNALLARPAQAPLADPQVLRPIPSEARLDFAMLEARLRDGNPQLFADNARVRVAEKSRDLTYRNRYPDFTVAISPMQQRNRVNEWELMVEFNIPLQQEARRSMEREAEKLTDAARARKEAATNQLLGDLSESLSGIDAARRMALLSQSSLLPQADLNFQAALTGYENGKVDFATLLDAQRQIRRARQDIVKAQFEQQARLADIERLIGDDL